MNKSNNLKINRNQLNLSASQGEVTDQDYQEDFEKPKPDKKPSSLAKDPSPSPDKEQALSYSGTKKDTSAPRQTKDEATLPQISHRSKNSDDAATKVREISGSKLLQQRGLSNSGSTSGL